MRQDTIFALATPAAKSGVAIIRISGTEALAALRMLTKKHEWSASSAVYTAFLPPHGQPDSAPIDQGLALYFKAPKSFTGEDVVELHLHGSLAIINEMLCALGTIPGLRQAERGEFTRRAFMNGKMDLIEAEGLADLIEAETLEQKRQALRQMQGEMSRYFDSLRAGIMAALAHLEAYIDFPDEDIPPSVLTNLSGEISELKHTIAAALADGMRGERLRDGLSIVILGAPNAGKSSLLNTLAKRDAAIVSHRAGTTRDVIEIHMDISGFPVTLMDTAGLRESNDEIEEEGVRRALERANTADIRLIMFDSTCGMRDEKSRGLIDSNTLIIYNKIDVTPPEKIEQGAYYISTKTAEGIEKLIAALEQKISALMHSETAPMITRNRHRELLSEALRQLDKIDFTAPLELTCEELRQASVSIGKITGKIAVDDVLGIIFSQFCIGK